MSRASNVRDGVIEELKILRPLLRIVPFWSPNFPAEWLDGIPIIGVRASQRLIDSMQGPDRRMIGIEVGVFGLASPSDETTTDPAANLAAQVKSGDDLDGITEDLISLWTPAGPLDGQNGKGIADHSFQEITQSTLFDAPQLQEFGLWAAVFLVTYFDTLDD